MAGDSAAPDEWSVGKLDLDAYLHRIGYDGAAGSAEPSEATLAALHRAHLAAIPFENLNLMLGRGISVDLDSIQAKLVDAKRGGYCYEHGQLFGAALERLGFQVDRLLARVGPDGEPVRPRTHLTLRVRANAGIWLADVGFGNSPPGPLSLDRPRSSGPQDLDGWIYEIVPDETRDSDSTWKLRELQGGEWVSLYRYEDQPAYPADVVMSNHYTATYPESWFTWQPIVARRDPDAVHSIVGRVYTITRPGHVKARRTLTDAEFAAALSEIFGLTFTDDELAALVAAPTGVALQGQALHPSDWWICGGAGYRARRSSLAACSPRSWWSSSPPEVKTTTVVLALSGSGMTMARFRSSRRPLRRRPPKAECPCRPCHPARNNRQMVERLEVQRAVAASAGEIFAVLSDPRGHVAIDSSGMLMEASGDVAAKVGDTFVVHMDREALNDYPLGLYDVTVEIVTFEPDREIAWTVHGQLDLGHVYGYQLEPIEEGTLVTSYYDWSAAEQSWKDAAIFPVIPESALRATLGILARTVAPGKPRPRGPAQ